MNKRSADKIALVMARDILRSRANEAQSINYFTAQNIASFVKELSEQLQQIVDGSVTAAEIINSQNHSQN